MSGIYYLCKICGDSYPEKYSDSKYICLECESERGGANNGTEEI